MPNFSSCKRLAIASALCVALWAQGRSAQVSPFREADRKLFAEIEKNHELMANLEYLCDMIGPRLTGSDKARRANQWTLEKFRAYGLEARLEAWSIGNAWQRGTAAGRIVEPAAHSLTLASAGWAPSTNGPLRGQLMYAKADQPEDLEPLKGKLAGKILLTTEPARVAEAAPAQNAADALRGERGREELNLTFEERARLRRQLNELFKKEGVAAILRESSKEHGLLNMSGVGGNNYQIGAIPTAFLVHEDYARLWRLLQRKVPVEVELDIRNQITAGPVEVYNTVAEIRGREKPEEIVLVGAHLDSWDLGSGATDNATGSAVTLETARALKASGLAPKRTIRFALFTGEEQGLVGSREYIKAHQDELDRIQGIVIHDTGTGRVKSFTLEGRYDLREALDKIVEPLREVGLEELSMRRTSGSDHVPFRDAGVPAFFGIQDPAEYRKTHHSQSDTFDKLRKDDLVQGAKVVAALAWNLAEYPEKLPRKPPSPTRGAGSSPRGASALSPAGQR
jgi:hypothetical protein